MSSLDESSQMLKNVRASISELLKKVDDFAVMVEAEIRAREEELDESIKRFKTLGRKEQELKELEERILVKEREIIKQQRANRDFQIALQRKEQELDEKLKRVQNILN